MIATAPWTCAVCDEANDAHDDRCFFCSRQRGVWVCRCGQKCSPTYPSCLRCGTPKPPDPGG